MKLCRGTHNNDTLKKTVDEESKSEDLSDYERDAGDSSRSALVSTRQHTRQVPVSAMACGRKSTLARTSTPNELMSAKKEVSVGVWR